MKQIFFSLLLLAFAGSLSAQQRVSEEIRQQAQTATDALVDAYALDAKQTSQMYRIQERKLRNTAEIEAKHSGDRDLYVRKMQALETGTNGSIQLILNKDQITLHRKAMTERRERRAVRTKELTEQGMSREDIELELLKVE